jgi:DNA-binding CsgD family transcriptional regulator
VDADEALGQVAELLQSGLPVVAMASGGNAPDVASALSAWSVPVADKSEPLAQLVTLVRETVGSERGAELDNSARNTSAARSPFDILSRREKFVLSQLMDGQNADSIARASIVSISTVRSQIKSILQKLGVNSQLAAVSLARQASWVFEAPQERPAERAAPSRSNRYRPPNFQARFRRETPAEAFARSSGHEIPGSRSRRPGPGSGSASSFGPHSSD